MDIQQLSVVEASENGSSNAENKKVGAQLSIDNTFDKLFDAEPVVYRLLHHSTRRRSLSLGACEVDDTVTSPGDTPTEVSTDSCNTSFEFESGSEDEALATRQSDRKSFLYQTRTRFRSIFQAETLKPSSRHELADKELIENPALLRSPEPDISDPAFDRRSQIGTSPSSAVCATALESSWQNSDFDQKRATSNTFLRRTQSMSSIGTRHTNGTEECDAQETSSNINDDKLERDTTHTSLGFLSEKLIRQTGLWCHSTEEGVVSRDTIPGYEYRNGELGLGYYSKQFDPVRSTCATETMLRELIQDDAVCAVSNLKDFMDGSLIPNTAAAAYSSSDDSDSSDEESVVGVSAGDTENTSHDASVDAEETSDNNANAQPVHIELDNSPTESDVVTAENVNANEVLQDDSSIATNDANVESEGKVVSQNIENNKDHSSIKVCDQAQSTTETNGDEHSDINMTDNEQQQQEQQPSSDGTDVTPPAKSSKKKKQKPNDIESTEAAISNRLKVLAKELRKLPKHVPVSKSLGSMFVRFDDEQPFLLKCGLTGIAGTPYGYGVFLFDILCPPTYPEMPPKVVHVTPGSKSVQAPNGPGGFSPNLHKDTGKVCLSLLGTWSGPGWNAGSSNLYQVLSSIMLMVLGSNDPYSMEPGYGGWEKGGIASSGESSSESESEDDNNREKAKRDALVYRYDVAVGTLRHGVLGHLLNPPTGGLEEITKAHLILAQDDIMDQLNDWLRECERFLLCKKVRELEKVREDLREAFDRVTPLALQVFRVKRELQSLQELRSLLHSGLVDALTKLWKLEHVAENESELRRLKEYLQKLNAAMAKVTEQIKSVLPRRRQLDELQQMSKHDTRLEVHDPFNQQDSSCDTIFEEDSDGDLSE